MCRLTWFLQVNKCFIPFGQSCCTFNGQKIFYFDQVIVENQSWTICDSDLAQQNNWKLTCCHDFFWKLHWWLLISMHMFVPKCANSYYRQWICHYVNGDQYAYWYFWGSITSTMPKYRVPFAQITSTSIGPKRGGTIQVMGASTDIGMPVLVLASPHICPVLVLACLYRYWHARTGIDIYHIYPVSVLAYANTGTGTAVIHYQLCTMPIPVRF